MATVFAIGHPQLGFITKEHGAKSETKTQREIKTRLKLFVRAVSKLLSVPVLARRSFRLSTFISFLLTIICRLNKISSKST